MAIKKRFIAGASCPKCHNVDTLRCWMDHDVEQVECVECGYSEEQKTLSQSQPKNESEEVIAFFKPE